MTTKTRLKAALQKYDYEDAYKILHDEVNNVNEAYLEGEPLCSAYKELNDKKMPYGKAIDEYMQQACLEETPEINEDHNLEL